MCPPSSPKPISTLLQLIDDGELLPWEVLQPHLQLIHVQAAHPHTPTLIHTSNWLMMRNCSLGKCFSHISS